MDGFTCQARVVGDRIVIGLHGDLDTAAHDRLISATTPWLASGTHIVLDCSGITFIDSRGMQSLVELHHMAAAVGADLILTALPHAVSRIFRIAGVEGFFTVDRVYSL